MEFAKMHGLGNDFILMNGIQNQDIDYQKITKRLCDRHMGIGADGVVIVMPSDIADIRMRIINSDGSEPNMCGNAIRCFAKYVFENDIVKKQKFSIETLAGIIVPELNLQGNQIISIKVNMGKPVLERKDIPMNGQNGNVINEVLKVGSFNYMITSMLMAVPHTIIFTSDVDNIELTALGPKIEKHPVFLKGTNVNFVQIINNKEIKLRTWERGVGATLACGTGSCASVVASVLNGKTGNQVTAHLEVGDLYIEWAEDKTVYMTGPATEVFKGKINL